MEYCWYRVDWLFSPGEVVGTALESPPAYVESVGPFLELFGQWKPAVPIVRFAFGGISNLESPNAEASYSIMSNYMNFDLDRSLSSDFIYQINKKRESGVISPVLINRLTKWSCAQAGQVAFAIVDEKITSMAEPGGVRCFCRLEFDINTIPIDGYVLPEDKLIPLANELDGMAREIMREGDL